MRPGRSSSTDCRATESPASCGAFRTSAASSEPSSSVPRSRGLHRTQSFGTGGEPPSGGEPSTARIRHQVDCGWAQTPANVSEVTAGARTSQTCAGEGQSHCGVSGRRAGGGDRADPVFHPSNDETHSNRFPVNSAGFSTIPFLNRAPVPDHRLPIAWTRMIRSRTPRCLACGRPMVRDTDVLPHPRNGTPWCRRCAPIGLLRDGKTHVLPNLGPGYIIDAECTGVDDVALSLWAWEDCYAMKPRKRIRKADAKVRIKEIWSLGTEESPPH